MTVLIDSWAWIEYLRGSKPGEKVKEYVEDEVDVVVSTINIAEVYRWILRYYDERVAEEIRIAIGERSMIIEVSEEIAVQAAHIKHDKGWGLGDSIIYATAKREGAKVLTGDPDFKGLDDVIFLRDLR